MTNKWFKLFISPVRRRAFFSLMIGMYSIFLCNAHFTHTISYTILHSQKQYVVRNTEHLFPNPLNKIFFKRQKNKVIAAALAFPFPFGCVGLHRVYLGTSPYVPIVYAATAGGVFGILPMIDCIVLISSSHISRYENNPKVIMWIHHPSTDSSEIQP